MTEFKNASLIYIFNDKNELALQLRAAHDDSFPLHWDFSVGGGIDEGEDPEMAAKREAKEELGIDVSPEFVGTYHISYKKWNSDVIREEENSLFKTVYNETFNPNPNEVEDIKYFSIEDINQMIKSPEKFKFHPAFLLIWDKNKLSN